MDDSSEEIIKRLTNSSDSEMMDDSIEEIIKRLPIKKVFQCMSLSTHLHSRILSPAFTESYRQQHPCYLIMNDTNIYNQECWFYYSPLLPCGDMISETEQEQEPEEFVKSLTVYKDNYLIKHTQPVQDLFCVYSFSEKSLSIYHLWRGEIMKLPYPLVSESETFNSPDYIFFGFEPVNGVYKLLKISPLDKYYRRGISSFDSTSFDCQMLTIDMMDCNNKHNFSWRKLPHNILAPLFHPQNNFPLFHPQNNFHVQFLFGKLRFSVDGFLFWGSCPTHGLICFDLKEENFFLVKPPPDLSQIDFLDSLTTQYRGQFALFNHNTDVDEKLILNTLTIQKLDDDDNNQGYTYAWTKHSISLLSLRGFHDRYFPVGNLPTGEMLLSNLDATDPFTIVYAYNHETCLFQKFIAGKQKMEFDRLNHPKELIYIACCVQPSFTTPGAFGASFSGGD